MRNVLHGGGPLRDPVRPRLRRLEEDFMKAARKIAEVKLESKAGPSMAYRLDGSWVAAGAGAMLCASFRAAWRCSG